VPPTRTLPNGENGSLQELTAALNCAPFKRCHQRLIAIKELLYGVPFESVCGIHSISERTLQRWVAAFNRYGIDGLLDAERPGRPKALESEQRSELHELVKHPERAGRAHWTGVRFHGHLREELGIEVSYRTVIRFLHEEGFRLKVPQPWPDRQDEEQREAFRGHLRELVKDEGVELWFGDETGIEGDPRPRRRWIQRGKKGRVTKNGDHVRMNVCGIVAPRTGEAFLCEFTHSDSETFQAFLDEANEHIAFGRERQILVLDNASWHKSKRLRWGRFEPLFLPPYSPDLNPIERLWLLIKAEWFTDFVAKDRTALIERLDKALLWAVDRAENNRQTCAITTRL